MKSAAYCKEVIMCTLNHGNNKIDKGDRIVGSNKESCL